MLKGIFRLFEAFVYFKESPTDEGIISSVGIISSFKMRRSNFSGPTWTFDVDVTPCASVNKLLVVSSGLVTSCVQDVETGSRARRVSEEQNNESQKQKVPRSVVTPAGHTGEAR